MNILSAKYNISSPDITKCPKADRPEFAFIGRSNVGKSSLINMMVNHHNLAKTSSTPGKTQLINHFDVKAMMKNDKALEWYLVDLPGYGFAKVSISKRKTWEKMIQDYVRKRETLVNLFILIDARHEPQEIDINFVNKLGEWGVPFSIVFTKADKETQKVVANHVNAFMEQLKKHWEELPPHFVTSAVKKSGRDKLLEYMEDVLFS
jgi:GTP-binding protein